MGNRTLFVFLVFCLHQATASLVEEHLLLSPRQKSWVPLHREDKGCLASSKREIYRLSNTWKSLCGSQYKIQQSSQDASSDSSAFVGNSPRFVPGSKFTPVRNSFRHITPADKLHRKSSTILAMSTTPTAKFATTLNPAMPESPLTHAHLTAQSAAAAALKRSRDTSVFDSLITMSSLILWYYFNVLYNIENKKALNLFPLPYTVATLQMYVGLPIFLIPWLLGWRKRPQLYKKGVKAYWPFISQAFWHSMVHVASVVALGAGAISFVHIVKAAEPAFTAVLSSSILGARMSILTYLCLFPIIFGVGLASLKELSFTWKALSGAMLSNIGSAMRGIEAKVTMSDKSKIGKNITPANIYAIMTIFAALMLSPFLLLDATKWVPVLTDGLTKGITPQKVLRHIISSGLWYYLYNEIAFIALGRLNPVSHAVANTIKRIFLILTSVVVFGSRFTPLGAAGSSLAVLGTLLYSLSKQRFG
ncbi:putative Glucose-6-phosphate/phosphate translocator 1 [Cardiosporidium cionae]|uniref:Glucose-6-phosphate/phosphate translocator 1 n=1 Tax=Cardiosporidium cionae TaxID=476202 RepID=A0ABQ7J5L1_9APIC|nr:putative Glucose-6-phosphate/phosphate translocator 1 [Cardiosporidium cionae]|eukprot:KAF8819262.1 putative Glucose-6-phosphate/phosphate translocator 1 [Cardiosporidium cionae]